MGKAEDRRARAAAALQLFVKQYARKAPKHGEPNDRNYDRKIEARVKRMSAEDLDGLLRTGDD